MRGVNTAQGVGAARRVEGPYPIRGLRAAGCDSAGRATDVRVGRHLGCASAWAVRVGRLGRKPSPHPPVVGSASATRSASFRRASAAWVRARNPITRSLFRGCADSYSLATSLTQPKPTTLTRHTCAFPLTRNLRRPNCAARVVWAPRWLSWGCKRACGHGVGVRSSPCVSRAHAIEERVRPVMVLEGSQW